jgi:CheY-like chemotaxis protein
LGPENRVLVLSHPVPNLDNAVRSGQSLCLECGLWSDRANWHAPCRRIRSVDQKKILIVDDNRVEVSALSGILKSSGFEVLVAEDGAEAVSAARRAKPDIILLDILFPPDVAHGGGVPWDGFLILSWLNRLEEAKNVPVIFVTGAEPTKYEKRALAAGAAKFFRKPIEKDELLAAIQQALAARKPNVPKKKRVLFVDDEGDWRFVAGTCLEDAGFEVVTAKDAAEALRSMETFKLDGIVLDLNLAGENGLLLMELLKQKHPGVPILIYTGMDHDSAQIQTMLQQGARQYLRKGSMAELCNTLKSMVN